MIIFRSIKWKNFLSTGNVFTEISLTKSQSTLILGHNGSGKSTILDALCFVLYGKAFRKIKKDQLINSINQRDCLVEITFSSYGREYRIVRGIKPSVFEIYQDGSLINQSASTKDYQDLLERSILRMNMKSFTQIVILGSSSFVPFMQLTPAVRREVLEDLLDIRIFTTMYVLLKEKMSELKLKQALTEKDIEATKQLIHYQKEQIRKTQVNKDNLTTQYTQSIELLRVNVENVSAQIESADAHIDKLLSGTQDQAKHARKKTQVESLQINLRNKIKETEHAIQFFHDNETCPTCTQIIAEDIKQGLVAKKQIRLMEITKAMDELTETQEGLSKRLTEIEKTLNNVEKIRAHVRDVLKPQKQSDEREILMLQKQIGELQKTDTSTDDDILELEAKLSTLTDQIEALMKEKELHEVSASALRDTGVKARIVKQYIPIINTLVNKYLAAMEFFVKFELNENFEERILSRHRDEFTYESFSEGEKMRIDLALLFTWRTIARMKNSSSTNLLILDEVFDASLDYSGCEEFLKLIDGLERTNTFVISHKGDVLHDKFRSVIRIEKHNNFSRVMK